MRTAARSLLLRGMSSALLRQSARLLPRLASSSHMSLTRVGMVSRSLATSTEAFKPRKTVDALTSQDLAGKNVFVRVDFNVPQDKKTGNIKDATRIKEALPTIKYLIKNGAKVVLASHLGRPKKGPEAKFSLKPIAAKLEELLGSPVAFVDDCIGPKVTAAVDKMNNGSVLMLENARFYKQEEKNDQDFAKKLVESTKAQVYVNDAFGTAHRAHGTTAGVVPYINGPAVAGFLLAKELKYLMPLVADPAKPFIGIIGGAKVDTKIKVIETLIKNCDKVVLGGAMIFPFYKAQGIQVGGQKVEDEQVKIAQDLLVKAKEANVELVLPVDLWCADAFAADAHCKLTAHDDMPAGWLGLDIGPKSVAAIAKATEGAKTIFWNGPMGVFEMTNFADGTLGVAKLLASMPADVTTVVGGGDSVSALAQTGLTKKISHVSTGGGASLELMEGEVLPGVAALQFA